MARLRWLPTFAVTVTCMTWFSTFASAQHGWVREDGWLSSHAGYGWTSWICSTCAPTRAKGSVTGGIRIGGTVNPHVLIGGDLNIWGVSGPVRNTDVFEYSGQGLAAEVLYYPRANGGFFVNGGIGYTSVCDSAAGKSGEGIELVAGLGFDSAVHSWTQEDDGSFSVLFLTPMVNVYQGSFGTLTDPTTGGARGRHWRQSMIEVGLALTVQRRRPG